MVRRMRESFSRRSLRLKATVGAAGLGAGGGVAGATGAVGATGAADLFSAAFCASSLVMRPSLPLPLTSEEGTPASVRILEAAGEGCPVA